MRLTNRTDIAVRTLMYLAIHSDRIVPIDEIVEKSASHRSQVVAAVQKLRKTGFGAIDVIPLYPRTGAPATRVLVRALRASRAPLRLLPGFVLHDGIGSDFTGHARAVMRDGAGLVLPKR